MHEIVKERVKFFNTCSSEIIRMSVRSFKESYKKNITLTEEEKNNIIKYNLRPNNPIIDPTECLNVCRYLYGSPEYHKYLQLLLISIIDYLDPCMLLYRKGSIDNETMHFASDQMNFLLKVNGYKIFDNEYKLESVDTSIKDAVEFMNNIVNPKPEHNVEIKFVECFNTGSGWTIIIDVWMVYINQIFNLANYLWTITQIESLDASDNLIALKEKFDKIIGGKYD